MLCIDCTVTVCVLVCAVGLQCFSKKKKVRQECPNIESWRAELSDYFPLCRSLCFPILSYDFSPLCCQWSSSSPAELIPPGLINQNWHTSGGLARHNPGWTLIKIVCLNLQFPSLPVTFWHSTTWQSCESWCEVGWICAFLSLGGWLSRMDAHKHLVK